MIRELTMAFMCCFHEWQHVVHRLSTIASLMRIFWAGNKFCPFNQVPGFPFYMHAHCPSYVIHPLHRPLCNIQMDVKWACSQQRKLIGSKVMNMGHSWCFSLISLVTYTRLILSVHGLDYGYRTSFIKSAVRSDFSNQQLHYWTVSSPIINGQHHVLIWRTLLVHVYLIMKNKHEFNLYFLSIRTFQWTFQLRTFAVHIYACKHILGLWLSDMSLLCFVGLSYKHLIKVTSLLMFVCLQVLNSLQILQPQFCGL